MSDEIKEITKVDKELLNKIEHILASELNCEEYDMFYNYFNEIRKPNILIDIKDDENIKELITNLQKENAEHNDKVVDKAKWNEMIYKSRIDKAIEIYENSTSVEYKKKRFMGDKTTADLMYEVLQGEDKDDNTNN